MLHERFDIGVAPGLSPAAPWSRRRVLLCGGALLLAGTGVAFAGGGAVDVGRRRDRPEVRDAQSG